MKLFPERKYDVELESEIQDVFLKLKEVTKISNSLVSERTKMQFIGQVKENEFKIISSEIGKGAFCVLKGKFEGRKGMIEINIHKAFRVMLSIIMTFPFIGFGIAIFQNGFVKSISILVLVIMALLFLRFVFMELTFRYVSNKGFNKLKRILVIKNIHLTNS